MAGMKKAGSMAGCSGCATLMGMSIQEKLLFVAAIYLPLCFLKGLIQGLLGIGARGSRTHEHVSASDARADQLRRETLQERIAARRAGRLRATDVL